MEPPNHGPNRSQKHDKNYGQPPSPKVSVEIGQVSMLEQHDISPAEDDDLVTAVKKAVNHRRLGSRQLQLTAIAGSIGASLFVAIGSGVSSGPLCLLFSFIFWATIVFSIAQCQTEIVTLFPLDGSFIRLAGRMVDPALGVTAGWNLFFAQTSFVIFEATVINTLVTYWGYDQSPAVLISVSLVLYLALNIYRADVFGEAEFWLSLCKILLATGLIVYTLVVMLGGNPLHDRFGFRYWKEPGLWTGDSPVARLESFVNAVNVAGFVMSGPEYISMVAGEAKDPRRTVPRAFNTIMSRLIVFFIGGALCVGILVPSNDSTLTNGSDTYAGASPYVISMRRLQIPVLPSIVNAALLTSIVSAGNAYTFNASRSLHALALDGQAPAFLRRLNKNGVPYMAVIAVMLLSCLAFLALGSGSSKVLSWILNFCTASQMLNWAIMSATWIRFNAAVKAQNVDRQSYLPVLSRWQPYAAYWALFWATIFLWVQGYAVFLKGNWSVATFIFNYGIIALTGGIGIVWKVVKGTRFHRSKEVDLASDCDFFDALTEHYRGEREAEGTEFSTVKGRIMSKLF
ncbi:putative amino acid transporter [Aureobasidium pullulans]|uniref:Amino acid transporter n=1 Tax=Aureobasidium pullulans TaxID=5580 RepID=A0AB38LQB9_AURPU|nr:putative amino acid transporter [Aureobasidium pullulans]THZ39192.1 putative amino acid transporter [Aureobasidium pullulans]